MEKWLVIKNFPLYLISDKGRVFSAYKKGFLETRIDKSGYEVVNLYNNEKMFTCKVHRLVLEAFNPVEGYENLDVNHIDGCKTNNELENLEWCTKAENTAHAVKTGLIKTIAIQAIDPKTGQVVHEYPSLRSANEDGFQHSNISACLNGRSKTHKGFIWRRAIKEECIND